MPDSLLNQDPDPEPDTGPRVWIRILCCANPDAFFYFIALLTCLISGPGIEVVIIKIVQGHRVELGGGRLQIDQLIVGRGIVLHARLTRVKAIKKFFFYKT
jgi:hypothetical protein